jgi:hypothetical protein
MRTKGRAAAPKHPAALVVLTARLLTASAPTETLPREENHCISPLGDLNELYRIAQQIVNRFCPEVARAATARSS